MLPVYMPAEVNTRADVTLSSQPTKAPSGYTIGIQSPHDLHNSITKWIEIMISVNPYINGYNSKNLLEW